MQSRALSLTALMTLSAATAACAVPVSTDQDPVAAGSERIQGGTAADAYPEAILLDVTRGGQTQTGCTGALVGPRAVLTSGRCATQFDGWTARTTFSAGDWARGVGSAVYQRARHRPGLPRRVDPAGLVSHARDRAARGRRGGGQRRPRPRRRGLRLYRVPERARRGPQRRRRRVPLRLRHQRSHRARGLRRPRFPPGHAHARRGQRGQRQRHRALGARRPGQRVDPGPARDRGRGRWVSWRSGLARRAW